MKKETQTGQIAMLWYGKADLITAFWFYGVFLTFCLWFIGTATLSGLAGAGVGGALFLSLVLVSTAVGYQILVSVGIWRSAGRYRGKRVWFFAARSVVVLAALWVAADIWGFFRLLNSSDPARNSRNVAAQIDRDPRLPFSGFWKDVCSENFGFAIEPSLQGSGYSISFCGPGGCFKSGTLPDTNLVNDPNVRIIDNDTIEISFGQGFDRYVRCE